MFTLLKKNRFEFIIVLSIILLLPNFIPFHLLTLDSYTNKTEQFDANLASHLKSIDDIVTFADSIAEKKSITRKSLQYGEIFSDILRKRFYHGYSHYALNENWVTALAGKMIWNDLSAIVIANDMLKYPMAACSQQSIVLMECFKKVGIPYRKVGFDHHYALEGYFEGQWYFFDTNMEPDFSKYKRQSIDSLVMKNALFGMYKKRLDSAAVRFTLNHPIKEEIKGNPAPRARTFHIVTKLISHFAWILPLFFLFIQRPSKKDYIIVQFVKKKRDNKKNESSIPVL